MLFLYAGRVPVPQAYFITWTTYGTRLHGDARGTVDRKHNLYGHPMLSSDNARRANEQRELDGDPVVLTHHQRAAVEAAIREHAEFKSWRVWALNVRTNHVHVVCSANEPPAKVMNAFKAYATRRLRAEKQVDEGARVWTRHGSTRYLWDGVGSQQAIDYVIRLQNKPESQIAGGGV